MGEKYKLELSDYVGIDLPKFYDIVAEKVLSRPLNEDEVYDCTKIDVAENIQDEWFRHYGDDLGAPDYQIAMMLACYGPKVDSDLGIDEIIVYEGFISKRN